MILSARHVRKNKDGGFTVSKEMIVAVSFILLLLGALIPTVYGYATLNNKVEVLEKQYETAGPIHTAQFEELSNKVGQAETEIKLLKQKLDTISQNISEIKSDIKDIKNEMNIR